MNLFQKKHDWILGGFEFLRVDNVVADAGSGGSTFGTDEIGGVHYPRSKVVWGADGSVNDTSAAAPLPVVQTGTPGLPTGAATAAKQPALGTAGSSSTDVLSVQGIASGTALPISGTVTANAGSGTMAVSAASLPLPSGASTSAKQDTAQTTLTAISGQLPAALDSGNLKVAIMSGGSGGSQYAEDTAHAPGDLVTMAGAVRRDANTSLVGTDGDVAPMQVNAGGQLKVDGSAVTQPVSDAGGSLTVDSAQLPSALGQAAMAASMAVVIASNQTVIPINDNGGSVTVDGTVAVSAVTPGTGATDLGKAEDAAHASGDVGVMMLGVRRDANTTLSATDGDYVPPQFDANGNLKVAIIAGAGSGGTSIADDAAFTPATTSITPVGGTYRSTLDAVDDGDAGAFAMTANRALHVNLRDASGNELASGAQYAEDAAHTTGDYVTVAGAVRRDTAAVGSGADGDYSTLNVNASGRLYTSSTIDAALPAGTNAIGKLAANSGVDIGDVDVTSLPNVTLAAGTNTNEVVGDAAHDAAIAGNPVRMAGRAGNADYTAVANGDTADILTDLNGKQIVLPYAVPENFVSGAITSAMTGTTSTSLVAAPAAGLRNYITTLIVSNAHATVGTDVIIQDGSGGTTLMTIPAGAVYGGSVISLPVPLRQPTTATAIFCANVTTGASTKVSAVGYKAP